MPKAKRASAGLPHADATLYAVYVYAG
jgi:hypothetical protein